MPLTKKQIAFDLDTKELEKYYPTDNWRQAYSEIKEDMKQYGFVWQQGSVYISQNVHNNTYAIYTLGKLVSTYPWLNKCVRDCRVTNVGAEHNPDFLFDKEIDIPIRESAVNLTNEKDHIKELKRNGFQPTRGIITMMKKIDQECGCYIDMKTICDIYKGRANAPSGEVKECCNKIGQECKQQEMAKVSYR